MRTILKSTLLPLSLLAILISLLCSCNTVQGFGEDLQQGGEALQQAANENR
jgi:predicted small secreted protein